MNPLQALAAVAAPFGIAISSAAPIEIGAALPAVTAKDQDDKEVKLAETAAKGWTLVYFYPKADTPGCTKQACSLRDSFAVLTEKKVQVFGASLDDAAAQKAFQQKYKPHSMGFAKRQAFLFKDGKLVWRDLSASTDQQAADVLKEIGE